MSILKADILTFVSEVLRETYSGTQLDVAIKTCLADLSKANLLTAQDAHVLTTGDKSFALPDDFKEEVSIVPSLNSISYSPLIPFPGGLKAYKEAMATYEETSSSPAGLPAYYVIYKKYMHIYPGAGAAYTITTEYYKHHADILKGFGDSSLLLDGNSDYAIVPYSENFNFGSDDLTIDFRAMFASHTGGTKALVSNYLDANTGFSVEYYPNVSSLSFLGLGGGGQYLWSWTPTDNVWYHIAITRSGTSLRAFVDGTQIGSTSTDSSNITGSTNVLSIGALPSTPVTEFFNGWIDELRISKGIARWTEDFTVPVTAFGIADSFTKLLIHFDGTDGSMDDYTAETGQTVSLEGTAQLDTSQNQMISFDDSFTNALNFGTAYYKALFNLSKLDDNKAAKYYAETWQGMYEKEKAKMIALIPEQPHIIMGSI